MSTVTSTGTITSTGLGSGLDINGLVSQLMTAESQPLTQLNAKEASYQATLSGYGQVKSALSTYQTAMSGLDSASAFQPITATSGDSSVYTVTASSIAIPGSYSIEVTQLAQSQKLASSAYATVNDAVGSGTLNFQFGTDNGTGGFTVNNAKAAQSITIDAAHSSLSGIRDAINAANIGVSATIINDGTGYRLSITSNDTGAANSLKITTSNDADGNAVDNSGLSQLNYDPTGTLGNGKNLSQTVSAQDALLNVDGITNINKSSNTITDVIQGVTINLLGRSATGVPAVLSVSNDSSSMQTAVQGFVDAYNTLNETLTSLTAYNPTTQQGGILQGDTSVKTIQSQLRSLLTSNITGLAGNYKLLSNIGVSFQLDGTLALDATKLQAALNSDPNAVIGLFSTVGKASDSLINYASTTANTKSGSYAVSVTQLATQGYRDGAAVSTLANTAGTFTNPVIINANNNTLTLKIDGVQTGTITLAQGSYTTAAALTAEIQSKINGDSAMVGVESSVIVGFDNSTGKIRITSNRYGSASTAEIVSVGANTPATLGLSVGTSTVSGVDVAGTINGVPATGAGQFLTGATGNAAEGLKLQITGGVTGARGTVDFSQGYAQQLDNFATYALGATGPISIRTDGINKSIADIGKQVDAMNLRLANLQQRYLAQFNAMDALVGQMKATSDYLTQQLAILSSSSTGK